MNWMRIEAAVGLRGGKRIGAFHMNDFVVGNGLVPFRLNCGRGQAPSLQKVLSWGTTLCHSVCSVADVCRRERSLSW